VTQGVRQPKAIKQVDD